MLNPSVLNDYDVWCIYMNSIGTDPFNSDVFFFNSNNLYLFVPTEIINHHLVVYTILIN